LIAALGIEVLEPVSFAHQVSVLRIPEGRTHSLRFCLVTPGSYGNGEVWNRLFVP
jgi:hypothetical protein